MGKSKADSLRKSIALALAVFTSDLVRGNTSRIGSEGKVDHVQHGSHVQPWRIRGHVFVHLVVVDLRQWCVDPRLRFLNSKLGFANGIKILVQTMLIIMPQNPAKAFCVFKHRVQGALVHRKSGRCIGIACDKQHVEQLLRTLLRRNGSTSPRKGKRLGVARRTSAAVG